MNNQRKAWLHLVRDSAASAAVEYALIVALVATALVLASYQSPLNPLLKGDDTASRLFGGAAAEPARHTTPAASQPLASVPAFSSDAQTPEDRRQSVRDLPVLLAWGTLLLATGILVFERLRKRSARRQLRELDLSQEAVPEPSNPSFVKRQEIRRVLLKHLGEVLQSRILVRHVMSRRVRAVEPGASVAMLREVMTEEGFHHLLVMSQGTLLGVLSDRDLCGRCGKRAQDLMTRQPLTVSPDTPIGQAITTLLRHRISCLPVVEHGAVQGILTTTDMLLTLQCLLQLLEQAPVLAEAALAEAAPSAAGPAAALPNAASAAAAPRASMGQPA
jgi:acetoin utilization protein AcuB